MWLAAFSANFSAIVPPAAKKVISAFEKSYVSKFSITYSLSLKEIFFPALYSEATKYRLSNLKFFLSNTSRVFLPTFPVAPTIAMFILKLLY